MRKGEILLKYIVLISVGFILGAFILLDYLTIERHIGSADAIVVLAGASDFEKRTKIAAELWKRGLAPKVILSNDGQRGGWDPEAQRNPFFAERAVRHLIDNGVGVSDIEVLPRVVESTFDEAESVVVVAADRKYESLILVTSGYHTRRTLWTFERSAARREMSISFGVESPPEDHRVLAKLFWWVRPSNWRTVAEELPKLIYYRQVYY